MFKNSFYFFLSIGVLLLSIGCGSSSPASKLEKPNLVFIVADDMGIGDVGAYGQQIIQTPNIDGLAEKGIKFENFYAGSTVCAPSRASLMTGQHTGHTFVRGNGEFPLAAEKKILPELLKEQGYATAMYGKWGLGLEGSSGSPETRGWDEFLGHLHHVDAHFQMPDSLDVIRNGKMLRTETPEGSFANELFTEAAIDFISGQKEEQPFFLYLSFTVPHAELVVPDQYLEKHLDAQGESIHAPEEAWPAGRHYGAQEYPKAAYAAMVESVDAYVGRVMQTLKEKGIAENTLVIFTSDNGTHLEGGRTEEDVEYFKSSGPYRGVKRDLYSGGIKTPFIVHWPSQIAARSVSEHTGAFWDIYPTFAEITGATLEGELDGISLLPSLTGKGEQKEHEYLYWEFHEFGGKQAVLKDGWKAIRLNAKEDPDAPIELYNLRIDPGEERDLAQEFPQKTQEMTQLLDQIRTSNPNFNF